MNAAYIDKYHTKPLAEQQLKVTCMNYHVGHTITYEMSPYKYTCRIPGIMPVSVLPSFLYMFTSNY